MKKLILTLTAAGMLAFGQNTPPPAALAPGEIVRVVEVKQASASSIYQSLSGIFPGISRAGEGRVLIRGPVAVVDMIEEAIKKLDVAPPAPAPIPARQPTANVEITLQLLQGSNKSDAGGVIPNDLESTVRQLKIAFPYKNFRILDTEIVRGRNASPTETSGTLPGEEMSFFNLKYTPHVNPGPAPRSVHLERLEFGLRFKIFTDPGKTMSQYQSTGIITAIDVREGQKTVVAKTNIVGTEDAIFLVVTPKVIE